MAIESSSSAAEPLQPSATAARAAVHAGSIGWQHREAEVPLAEDTIYRLCSTTEPIVCTALMTLFEEGRLQLVDPVATWIPASGLTKIAGIGSTRSSRSSGES